MVLRVMIFLAILINLQFSFSLEDKLFSDVTQPLSIQDHKVLQDCHNEDYRTYLRCLKRHKRQHEIPGSGKSCLDDCVFSNCTSSECVQECYTRCKKKITETYSRVTETEYECSGGKCKEVNSSNVPTLNTNLNLTININSSNCENNKSNDSHKNKTDSKAGKNDDSKVTINNIITNLPASENSNCRCPGCNCFPWPVLPQITIGFGASPTGIGCCFPQPCTCFQEPPIIDCGYCAHPFLRYKCDPSCHNSTGPIDLRKQVNSSTSSDRNKTYSSRTSRS